MKVLGVRSIDQKACIERKENKWSHHQFSEGYGSQNPNETTIAKDHRAR
jgi:hypothetical protein